MWRTYVIVSLHVVYSCGKMICRQLLTKPPAVNPADRYVDDMAKAMVKLLQMKATRPQLIWTAPENLSLSNGKSSRGFMYTEKVGDSALCLSVRNECMIHVILNWLRRYIYPNLTCIFALAFANTNLLQCRCAKRKSHQVYQFPLSNTEQHFMLFSGN